jgi:hypothetical protein
LATFSLVCWCQEIIPEKLLIVAGSPGRTKNWPWLASWLSGSDFYYLKILGLLSSKVGCLAPIPFFGCLYPLLIGYGKKEKHDLQSPKASIQFGEIRIQHISPT